MFIILILQCKLVIRFKNVLPVVAFHYIPHAQIMFNWIIRRIVESSVSLANKASFKHFIHETEIYYTHGTNKNNSWMISQFIIEQVRRYDFDVHYLSPLRNRYTHVVLSIIYCLWLHTNHIHHSHDIFLYVFFFRFVNCFISSKYDVGLISNAFLHMTLKLVNIN